MRRFLGWVLIPAIVANVWPAFARSQQAADKPAGEKDAHAEKSRFDLKDGNRVVFIGNAFFERETRPRRRVRHW